MLEASWQGVLATPHPPKVHALQWSRALAQQPLMLALAPRPRVATLPSWSSVRLRKALPTAYLPSLLMLRLERAVRLVLGLPLFPW